MTFEEDVYHAPKYFKKAGKLLLKAVGSRGQCNTFNLKDVDHEVFNDKWLWPHDFGKKG